MIEGVLSAASHDFVSELGDKGNHFFDGSTISSLSEHGESIDKRKVGGVLAQSLKLIGNFF